jgi:dihydroneopterin aldolase
MNDIITITGIRGFGYHGVFEAERQQGQDFIVDISLSITKGAGADDQLEHTVDYGNVADRVYAAIIGPPFALIEALAQHIADTILQITGVHSVTITIHKPHAPITVPFDDVSITIQRP